MGTYTYWFIKRIQACQNYFTATSIHPLHLYITEYLQVQSALISLQQKNMDPATLSCSLGSSGTETLSPNFINFPICRAARCAYWTGATAKNIEGSDSKTKNWGSLSIFWLNIQQTTRNSWSLVFQIKAGIWEGKLNYTNWDSFSTSLIPKQPKN